MKKIILALIVSALAHFTNGQRNSYGISLGVGNGLISTAELTGAPSLDLNVSMSLGFQYDRKLTNKFHLVSGINWYQNSITVTPVFHPDADRTPRNYDLRLIYVPLFARFDLSRHFYLNGGLLADIDVTKNSYITSQSGVGLGFGFGVEFNLSKQVAMQINPYFNYHGVFLSKGETYPERVVDSGLKLNFILKK